MDFDLGQVRAFVVAAELSHFGRAAEQLYLTQQAVSKRIRRLEEMLGSRLFVRGGRTVELTEAGTVFLPRARRLLASAQAAAAAVQALRQAIRPVRVDVWAHLHSPLHTIRGLAGPEPDLVIEVSMRRSLPTAIGALQRGEIDAAFGRVHDLGHPWPDELRSRLIQLNPLLAIVSPSHALADRGTISPADLVSAGMWWPAQSTSPEVLGYMRRFAESFGIPVDLSGVHLGAESYMEAIGRDPSIAGVLPLITPVPAERGVVAVPLAVPRPLFPWSVVWRADDPPDTLLRELVGLKLAGLDPDHDWVPDVDRADLP